MCNDIVSLPINLNLMARKRLIHPSRIIFIMLGVVALSIVWISPCISETLFAEKFDDGKFVSRDWYDNTNLILTSNEQVGSGGQSAQFNFTIGSKMPLSGASIRKKFTPSEEIYLSYFVKHSANWIGSGKAYHPHQVFFMTNVDSDYLGPAYSHLTAYVEENDGFAQIGIQDGMNIDISRIGEDLTLLSESRAVAGCNGDSDGYGNMSCYLSGSTYWNWKQWRTAQRVFSDSPGSYYKNDWHYIEAYLKLNSISDDGKGIGDGIIQYWYDGTIMLDFNKVFFRTGQHPDMKFNQLLIAPWIGDGSLVDQTFWIDNLTLGTKRDSVTPMAPTNLKADP